MTLLKSCKNHFKIF